MFMTCRSVLYELCIQGQIFSMKPIQLPVRIQIKEVAVGKSHVVAITSGIIKLIFNLFLY